MRKIFYTIAFISSLAIASFAEETKRTPVQKPEAMSNQVWGERVLGTVDKFKKNPTYYEIFKDQKNEDPVMREALRIYEEDYLK
jgi:hypothetical protein